MKDNYSLFREREDKLQAELERLPKCSNCWEPIQDEYLWDFDGELYCEECARELFRKYSEDYEK